MGLFKETNIYGAHNLGKHKYPIPKDLKPPRISQQIYHLNLTQHYFK